MSECLYLGNYASKIVEICRTYVSQIVVVVMKRTANYVIVELNRFEFWRHFNWKTVYFQTTYLTSSATCLPTRPHSLKRRYIILTYLCNCLPH